MLRMLITAAGLAFSRVSRALTGFCNGILLELWLRKRRVRRLSPRPSHTTVWDASPAVRLAQPLVRPIVWCD
jgi:hypothetical protein